MSLKRYFWTKHIPKITPSLVDIWFNVNSVLSKHFPNWKTTRALPISLYKCEVIMATQADRLKYPEQSWVISLNPSVFVQHDPVWHRSLSESQIDIHLVKKQTVHVVTMQPATSLLQETIETSIWNTQWQKHANKHIYLYNIPYYTIFWKVLTLFCSLYLFEFHSKSYNGFFMQNKLS